VAWTEPKTIKIKFIRTTLTDNDVSISFQVDEVHREEFKNLLLIYLEHCKEQNAEIEVEDVLDGESETKCGLTILIKGEKEALSNELNNRISYFQAASTSVT
jgi:hypothetical protein